MTHGPRALARRLVARRVGGVVVLLLALGPAVVVASPAAQASTPSRATIARYEVGLVHEINVQRARHHRGRLVGASCPDRYAEGWAPHLARTGRFYHRSMRTILRGCRAHVAAENLARGNASAKAIVAAWMASPGHRRNILDRRLTKIGVAAVWSRGRYIIAADFTRP